MGTFWTEKTLQMYQDACDFLHYPEIPLQKYFAEIIRPDDTVMDIGSGPGAAAIYLSSFCKEVIAVEQDEDACNHLQRRIKAKGIKNIKIINGSWPEVQLKACDVTIMLYVAQKSLLPREKIRALIQSTRRIGISLSTQSGGLDFRDVLLRRLGLEPKAPRCLNACRTFALLEVEGAKVRCERIEHEFGQPVENLDDAAFFLMNQLHLDNEYLPDVRKAAEEYVEIRRGQLYIPKKLVNCLLIFEKQ